KPRVDGNDLILEASAKKARTNRDVVLHINDKTAPSKDRVNFSTAVDEGSEYLMVRFRPNLEIRNPQSEIRNRLWVFLFEASGARDPLLGRAQIEVIRNFLAHVEPSDKFMVAAANTRVRWHQAKPQAATPENIQSAIAFLDKTHLIGALDLANALDVALRAGSVSDGQAETYLIHVGSGIPAMGERRDDALVKRLTSGVASAPRDGAPRDDREARGERETQARYVGVGVGRRWNRSFMKAAAEKTGGHFTQINPDEPI